MFQLTIKTDNEAFSDAEDLETVRILREVANLILEDRLSGKTRDYNGNTVGEWSFSDD